MQNLIIATIWVVTGLLSAIAVVINTGIIPFIGPGLIVGICGATYQVLLHHFMPKSMWWLSAIAITIASLIVTMVLIPDARHWEILRLVSVFYFIFTMAFCFVKYVVDCYLIQWKKY